MIAASCASDCAKQVSSSSNSNSHRRSPKSPPKAALSYLDLLPTFCSSQPGLTLRDARLAQSAPSTVKNHHIER